MLKKIVAILAFAALFAYSAGVKYPYPQRKNYGNSTINVVNSTADADLKLKFENYIKNFYVESGNQARIKFYDPDKTSDADYTVSEGIGYAMIMAVYFSDNTTGGSYQSHFDKLWAYYQAHTNGNGFMNWKIRGFDTGNPAESNGATDAEMDVILALLMARYQFDDTKYETAANALATKALQHEVSSDGLLKPGDAWDNDRNPSYVAPAVFELLGSSWNTAKTRNYTFLKANQNGTSGLPSDWANSDGSPKQCTYCGYTGQNYGQDAVRAPWRWATANAWFGHADAKTLLTKLGTWVNGKTPADVKGPISLSGTFGSVANASYTGSLMCALTVGNTYQTKLNSFFNTMMTQTDKATGSYFNQSMLILTGLLVSGNMPNLKACASSSGCGTNMTDPGNTGGKTTTLDRLAVAGQDTEDNRSLSALWESWSGYTDVDADDGAGGKAKSTISNTKFTAKDENNSCKDIQGYRVIIQDGTEWVAKIKDYKLDAGDYKYDPFVALGLDARRNGKPASEGGYDLTKCTKGFSYQYKGEAHKFKILSSAIKEGSGEDHYKIITARSDSWKTITVPQDEMEQPSWVTTPTTFSLAKIRGWAWELQGAAKGGGTAISATTGSLAIKDFKCLGDMPLPKYVAPKCNPGATPPVGSDGSSSTGSGGSSSSSVASGGGSSSSVSGGGGSSSSSKGSSSSVASGGSSSSRGSSSSNASGGGGSSSSTGNTPIISLSQYSANNGAFAIKNGVNLQVSKTASLEVFSLNGKSVRKHEFSSGNYSLMLGDLPKGLYLVKVQFGNQREILHVPVR